MAGAGGGGFIFVVTKEPNMVEKVKELIKEKQVTFRLSDKILFFWLPAKRSDCMILQCSLKYTLLYK